METNVWANAFDGTVTNWNKTDYFNQLLKQQNIDITDSATGRVLYSVNTTTLTITNKQVTPNVTKRYSNSKYNIFFYWLGLVKNYSIITGNDTYDIMSNIISDNKHLYHKINVIFNKLEHSIAGGRSRRHRRCSCKYKKSKRVLRRKFRSTTIRR
jgi:hypothetical protein